MTNNDFPDLEGNFELLESPSTQLDNPISPAIAEEGLNRTYWKLSFRRVQYGTFGGQPACLMVVDGNFHAEDSSRHRFTWIRVKVGFTGASDPVEVLAIAPHQAFGVSVPEQRASNWSLSSTLSLTAPGFPATIDIFNAQLGYSKSYQIDRVAQMKGSSRGFKVTREAVWTLEEANQEGLPLAIPSLVVVVKYSQRQSFVADFQIDTKVGFSINPLRLPLLRGNPSPIRFDGSTEYLPIDGPVDRNFSNLDLSSLTKLNFKDK